MFDSLIERELLNTPDKVDNLVANAFQLIAIGKWSLM